MEDKYSQEEVDKIFQAAAIAANQARVPLAKMAVKETGMGIVEDKIIKNHYASEYIYNKYRDEKRPRFGLIRSREFIMKDLYSFDRDPEGLDKAYWDMYQAYTNVFNRCGLKFRPIEADGGAIGDSQTHEFTALAEIGENTVVFCDCGYAANIEIAPCPAPQPKSGDEAELAMEKVYTPDAKTIEAVSAFLNVPATKTIKTLFFQADEELICVLVRGDREVNEVKLANKLGVELEIKSTDFDTTLALLQTGAVDLAISGFPITP